MIYTQRQLWILLVFLLFNTGLFSQPAGYEHRKLITLNSSQISGSTDHANFPVMIKVTETDIKSTTNGGGVVNPSGYDIIFTQSDGSTLLKHELQNYAASTGDLLCWVNLPTLTPTVDSTIYLYYGKTGIYTDQSDTLTWNSNYLGVWHLEDLSDAAGAYTLTDHNTAANSSGYLGAAREFDGDGDDLEELKAGTYLDGLGAFTISLWTKADALGTDKGLIYGTDPDALDRRMMIRQDAAGEKGGGTNVYRTSTLLGTNTKQRHESSDASATLNWQYLTMGQTNGSATNFYIDGSLDTPSWFNTRSGITNKSTKLLIGKGSKDGATSSWDGLIDEVRISSVELSADWVTTEYTNMTNPGAFLTVSTTNELPFISDLESIALSYQSNDPAMLVTNSLICHDYSEFNMDSANVWISTNYLSSEDTLTFATAYGISGTWNESIGTLRLTGNASLNDYSSALQEVYYQNSNAVPSTSTRTLSFKISDGTGFSATVTRNITIGATNNAPVLASIEGTTLAYTDGDPDTIITTSLSISDVDDYYLDSAWVTISANYISGEDKLDFTTAFGITPTWSSVNGELILTGSATKTDYQTALRSVMYDNLDPDPDESTRTISFKVSDGLAQSNIQSRNLSVTAVNDAPMLAGMEGAGLVYFAGDGAIAITDSLTMSDGDHTKLDSVTIQITTNYHTGEDSLGYTSIYGITGTWYSGIGKIVLAGNKSISTYQTAVRTVIYENLLAIPHTPTRVITFNAYDLSAAESNAQTRAIASGEPATISGLDLWLNSNEGVYTNNAGTTVAVDGDDVQVWKDQSGNGRDFINNSGAPLWRQSVAGLNGESAIEWSGGGEFLVDGDGELYIDGLTEFTTFFVVKSDITSTDKGIWCTRNAANGDYSMSLRYDAVGDNASGLNVIKAAVREDVAANELESSADQQSTVAQVICMDWKDGQTWNLYVDGVLNNPSYAGAAPDGAITAATKAILGQSAGGGWDGMIAEVVHYNRHLNDTERQSIEDYFSDKYAISVRLLEPATGGEAISADDAISTYTTLTGPRITEDVTGDLTLGGTIVFTAPSGYEWDTAGALPSVTAQEAYGTSTLLAASYTSRTSSEVTFTIDAISTIASQPGELTFSGLQIRPTTGMVPNTGNISNSGTTGPNSITNFGTITMVAGTPTKVVYTQEPTNGTVNELLPSIIAEIQDTNGNTMEIPGTSVSIAITTGIGTLSGTTSLNTDAAGQVVFSDLAINAADDFILTASSSGLTSAVSNTFSTSVAGQYTTFLVEKLSGGNILAQTAGVDFNIKVSAVDGTQTADVNFDTTAAITSTGTLSNGGGTTAAFSAGVLSSYTMAISSIGSYTITATDTSGNIYGTSNTFTVESGPASAGMSTISTNPTVLENDAVSTSTITVQIKDAGSNNHSSGGETVNLITTAGTLLGSVTDNGDGTYSQALQSSSTVEEATITGVLNGNAMTDAATVQFNAYTNIWESDPGNDSYTTRWDTIVNWDANTIPVLTDAVLIPANPADGTRYPLINTDNQQVASLTIESGADVSLTGSISFDILGDILGAGDILGGANDTVRVSGNLGIATSSIKYYEMNGSTQQVLSSPLTLYNLTVDNSSGVRLDGNTEITSTLTLTTGSLIVSSGYSLIANTKSISSGTIRSEREITGTTGWRLLASPVASTYGDLFNNIFTQGYTGSDSATGSPSILYYDESYTGTDNQRWRKPTNSTNTTTAGRGLFVYVFGAIAGESAYSNSLPVTLDVSGDEEEGTAGVFDFGVTYTALADTGWNLVGNPFAATIDWDVAGWTKTNMDNVIYIWDHTANSGAGAYLTWNGTSGSLGDGLIPPFQGFWVKANAGSPSLRVPKSAKTTGGVFYKQNSEPDPLIMFLLESDTLGSTTHIQFNESGSIYKDSRDAYYLVPPTDTYLELYTRSYDNKYLSIQSHPYRFGQTLEIPIYVDGHVQSNPLSGTYRISWPRFEGMHPEWTLTLEDLESDEVINLSTQNFYEFEHTALAKKPLESIAPSSTLTDSRPFQLLKKSAGSPRFILRVDPGNAFPELPRVFSVGRNYPNPFNEGTIIPFSVPLEAKVSATIYDLRGRVVDELVEKKSYQAGHHKLNWQARDRSSGIYFCHFQVGNKHFTEKMILLR
ncbi:MAG: DUF2341 domain-containing protein [Candidatus Marinimicrobia bacterium]|nr:DUF2341 domain-containing protein [Candidatus Neomarinimicrobiota bacterium]